MAFKDIVGNAGVKKILHRALKQKKLPNSLLFTGPEGIGKKETALVVAKALSCLKKTADACEECSHCRAIEHNNFPDVMVISPAKDMLKIDQMRLLKEMAYMKPMAGGKRIFIIEEAEKMNEEASNSLLKILEEPPAFSHIILITPNPFRIIPTIKSRCRIVPFSSIPREDIQKALIDKGVLPERARILSLLSEGNLKNALSLEWEEVQSQRKKAWHFFCALNKKEKAGDLLNQYSASRTAIKEELEKTLNICASFCRDIILIKEEGETEFLLNPDLAEDLEKAARSMTVAQAMDFLEQVDFAVAAMRKNLNVNILVSSMFSNFLEWSHV